MKKNSVIAYEITSSHMIQLIILEIIPLIEDKEVRRLQNLSFKTNLHSKFNNNFSKGYFLEENMFCVSKNQRAN